MKNSFRNLHSHELNKQGPNWWDGRLAIGIIIGISFSVLAVLLVGPFGFELSRSEGLNFFPAIATILLAGFGSLLAWIALQEQQRIRMATTNPMLIAHFGQDLNDPIIITFNISNVGTGVAYNVRLTVLASCENASIDLPLTNIFKSHHPIQVILPNRSISYGLGSGPDLLKNGTLPTFLAKLFYEDNEGSLFSQDFSLDPIELNGLGANSPPIRKIESHIKEISKTLSEFVGKNTPLLK